MSPSAPNVSSSEGRTPQGASDERRSPKDDLDHARQLSRALSQQAPPGKTKALAGPSAPFSRFGVAPHAPRPLGVGAEGWRSLLAEAIQLTHATNAVALDESGLLIAAIGVGKDEAEALGSRIIVAFEHLDRAVSRACRSLTVDLGESALTAFRGGAGGGTVVTFVLRSQTALPEATRAAVMGLLHPPQARQTP